MMALLFASGRPSQGLICRGIRKKTEALFSLAANVLQAKSFRLRDRSRRRGGGKADLAQGSGTDPDGIDAALSAVRAELARS
jgi:alanyl-tRNA synthetase